MDIKSNSTERKMLSDGRLDNMKEQGLLKELSVDLVECAGLSAELDMKMQEI